ncbi:MAG: tetratricopeptide repeat protein [Pseudomonadota bacterium]|nr:tetratricopeptide repeat protein [Pseudomonadota bacterium]
MNTTKSRPDYATESYEMPIEEAIHLAREHHLVGNFVIAERTYKDILKSDPNNPTVNHLLGALYFQTGDQNKALHFMEESIRVSPNEIAYLNNYGSALNLAKKYNTAIETFDKILSLDSANVEALNRKATTLWQMNLHQQAEDTAKRALELAPDNLDGLLNLGLALTSQGKNDAAHKIWLDASKKYPGDCRIWSNWANMLREAGEVDAARECIDKALAIEPLDLDALNNLGCIYKDLGQYEEAIETFRKATDASPKYYQAHYNAALTYNDMKRFGEGAVAARYAVDFNPEYGEAFSALSANLIELGEFQHAHYAAQRAVQINPDSAEAHMQLADVLYLSDRFDDGYAALKQALSLAPDDFRTYSKLASVYDRLNETQLAIEALDKAIELAPDKHILRTHKATILHVANEIDEAFKTIDQAIELAPENILNYISKAEIFIAVNKLDDARATLQKALDINPDNPMAYNTLSGLVKIESEDDEIFQKMLSAQDEIENMGMMAKATLHYGIASTYEKLKNYEKAFEHYKIAGECKRKMTPFNSAAATQRIEGVKSNFNVRTLEAFKGYGSESDSPIFIVGMPRSGTTLTEQIISSHPDVYGAGELSDLGRAQKKVGTLTTETAKEMGDLYVELSRARQVGGEFKHVSDKMPSNYMNIGLIASILPNAKIIHCMRDPIDTCLSCYKQNFYTGQSWSYDLEELADEYQRYLDLMAYWDKVLPGKIFHISYEDTVNDVETQARKLIDYIGLEWNDACATPHKKERAVLTASKMQVTKPVYTSSVQKWKRFEEHLQPLVRRLKPEEALPLTTKE